MDPILLPEWLLWDKYVLEFIRANAITLDVLALVVVAIIRITPWTFDDAFLDRVSQGIAARFRRKADGAK